jgi:DNA end-binding protein Ku
VRFHELDSHGRRVRHVRLPESDFGAAPQRQQWSGGPDRDPEFNPRGAMEARKFPFVTSQSADLTQSPIPVDEIRKGYEVAPGEYVSLSREEVQLLAPERNRAIDVEQFVDIGAVDPIYFESRYYVTPDRDSIPPFRVLKQAMAGAGRMAIAWVMLRQRRYLSAIRPFGHVMLLTTMVHADEVLPVDFWLPEIDAPPTETELNMARLLIDTLAGPFEPERYTDDHRQRLLDAIEAKAPMRADVPNTAAANGVLDLMAALEASVRAAKAARAAEAKQSRGSRRQRGTGSR